MNDLRWYSGVLRFFTVTADKGRVDGEDSIYLIRATDWEAAFRRFLDIGYMKENTYKNWHEQETRVRFIAIRTIDVLNEEDLDGIEVSCVPLDGNDPEFTFETSVSPENSKPGQLGV